MAENRNALCGCQSSGTDGYPPRSDSVYIDVNRILDSCRDRDCFENVRVYFPECAQQLIDRAGPIRARGAWILDTCMNVSPMTFNRGFYQITCRIYVKLEFETCIGGNPQVLEGLAAVDKSVILFGSEGGVRIFRSKGADPGSCCGYPDESGDNLPTAVLEIADPVVLSAEYTERCGCRPCSSCIQDEIPERISRYFGSPLFDPKDAQRVLSVTLGCFSVLRMERPAQFLISAAEYAVPDKECVCRDDESPSDAFRRMAFPTEQFSPPVLSSASSCSCRNNV